MYKPTQTIPVLSSIAIAILVAGCQQESAISGEIEDAARVSDRGDTELRKEATAILAGGCSWCVESDFEKLPGVTDVISGYSGGSTTNPAYQNYFDGGHVEVVDVTYDPSQVTYAGLVQYDKPLERGKPLALEVAEREEFWPAEDYHQNYAKRSLVKYGYDPGAKVDSGKTLTSAPADGPADESADGPADESAGGPADESAGGPAEGDASATADSVEPPWKNFHKPTQQELKQKLTDIQYKVTQQDGTETAYRNEYWDSKEAGIYVDLISGEPLFLSSDKYKSGTGWPSFVRPLDSAFITLKEDNTLFATRTEVRSKLADSHLGHIFDDGPPNRGGKRWCMNSAALKFVSKQKMEAEGYGEYVSLVEPPK